MADIETMELLGLFKQSPSKLYLTYFWSASVTSFWLNSPKAATIFFYCEFRLMQGRHKPSPKCLTLHWGHSLIDFLRLLHYKHRPFAASCLLLWGHLVSKLGKISLFSRNSFLIYLCLYAQLQHKPKLWWYLSTWLQLVTIPFGLPRVLINLLC